MTEWYYYLHVYYISEHEHAERVNEINIQYLQTFAGDSWIKLQCILFWLSLKVYILAFNINPMKETV